ncbi:hypothetical protein Pcinc_007077 [Petrolisthes cinctipes]|uniref:Golgi apparatus membrane protein TVP23 homolog n=1 Tax=Petrolisthes cinctipes TaxID=88211 RepID=A0AAE1GBP7_PETCI|nr:hypothetical protein Pcinc_007077 [Petrolisthes cinctipes]
MASNVPLLDNDDTLGFGEEDEPRGKLRHPFVTLFHLLFRVASLVVYELCGWFSNSFISSFIIIVILLSMDFWTVKNISGRIMVGLRWWNYIDDEGQSHWVFEAKKGGLQGRVSAMEVRIFWLSLFVFPLIWSILLLVAVFTWNFKWAMVVLIAVSLSGSNLYGYIRCKLGKSESITSSVKSMATGLVQKQMFSNMTSMFTRAPPATGPSTTI